MPTEISVLTEEQRTLRRELEKHLLSYPGVEFAGVGGSPEATVITLGGERTRLIADMLPRIMSDERLQKLSYQIAVVRGTAKK